MAFWDWLKTQSKKNIEENDWAGNDIGDNDTPDAPDTPDIDIPDSSSDFSE